MEAQQFICLLYAAGCGAFGGAYAVFSKLDEGEKLGFWKAARRIFMAAGSGVLAYVFAVEVLDVRTAGGMVVASVAGFSGCRVLKAAEARVLGLLSGSVFGLGDGLPGHVHREPHVLRRSAPRRPLRPEDLPPPEKEPK